MKYLIILGTGKSGMYCPFDTEVWAVNGAIDWARDYRVDRLFFFDKLETFPPELLNISKLKKFKNRITSTGVNRDYAAKHGISIEIYPLDEMCHHFGTKYFSNSISYMIALAIYEGYEKIHLWGIDHMEREEYGTARAGVEYWLGRAEQAGIEVGIAESSALLKTHSGKLYGYE